MPAVPETIYIYVSESAFLPGYFGIFSRSSTEPELETCLAGGFESAEEAIQEANTMIVAKLSETELSFPQNGGVEYRKRVNLDLEKDFHFLNKQRLIDDITSHLNTWNVKISRKNIIRGLLSYGNMITFGTIITLFMFWTGTQVTVPGLDMPIVGKAFAGKVLDAGVAAAYYPLALLVIFSASFYATLQRNISNNELRLKFLVLVKKYGWTIRDLLEIITANFNKGVNPVFEQFIGWVASTDPNSIPNLLKSASPVSAGSGDPAKARELGKDELRKLQ